MSILGGITVAIPTIPPRWQLLTRAVDSVMKQTLPVSDISIAFDFSGEGAGRTRQRALEHVDTDWVAFLDDDDEFEPRHLEILMTAALEEDADYVFSYYRIRTPGGIIEDDPVLGKFGCPFDPKDPHQTTTTVLVRTEYALAARCDNEPHGFIDGQRAGEDFQFTLRCIELGAHIIHVPIKTWVWDHTSGNTSGRPWTRPELWS